MKITLPRALLFVSFVLMIGLLMQQCWQSKTASEKWLYFFGESARDYAGQVLGPGRGAEVPVPEALHGTEIIVRDDHVLFMPKPEPGLVLAFSPGGPPDAGSSRGGWTLVGDGWYQSGTAAAE